MILRRPSRHWSASARPLLRLASVVAVVSAGCAGRDPKYLSIREKARLVKELRREADDCMARFQRSRGSALEELECFTEKHRLTTEVYPTPGECPECYVNYGHGLRALGNYYLTLVRKNEQELESASASRAAVIREKIRAQRETMLSYYRRSSEALEVYFRVQAGGRAYFWASENYGQLGDYDRALHFLELFASSFPEMSDQDRRVVEEKRRSYTKLYERQRYERLAEEKDGSTSGS